MKQMKLEGALKLYTVLYFLAFLLTFMMSVPMLKHVMPQSKCLLFVQETYSKGKPSFSYGSPGGCQAAGFLPLVVALGALGLTFFQWLQLRKLEMHLNNPQISSDEYRSEARVTFWKMIWVHCGIGSLVLVIAFILTAGYAITCRNMSLVVEREIRANIQHTPNSNQGQRNTQYDNFASDQTIRRYNSDQTDLFGRNRGDIAITCRSLLTDPQNHFKLLENHASTDQFSQYFGWNQWGQNKNSFLSDVGNFNTQTYQDNLCLEMSLAGAWISALLWLVILLLMVKERHHLRAHLTDESMWGGGSDYGPGSVRSGRSGRKTSTNSAPRTLMTPVDFDVRSNASRVSRASKSSKGTSYKDMGGVRKDKGGAGYKSMGGGGGGGKANGGGVQPSRLTMSRLEQVPSLPANFGVKKLLSGEPASPLVNDTMSVASGYSTVTGAVFGPSVIARNPGGSTGAGGLMDFFGSPQGPQPSGGVHPTIAESTGESEEL